MRRTFLFLLLTVPVAGGLAAQQRADPRALRREVAALRLRAMLGSARPRSASLLPGFGASVALPPLLPSVLRVRHLYLPLIEGIDLRAGVEWSAPEPRGSVGIRLRF